MYVNIMGSLFSKKKEYSQQEIEKIAEKTLEITQEMMDRHEKEMEIEMEKPDFDLIKFQQKCEREFKKELKKELEKMKKELDK